MQFVNAKLNIGLQIVSRRKDGYHNLQTIFYPIGIGSGSASNPARFADMIEIIPNPDAPGISLRIIGRNVDCPMEKNLVYRAAEAWLAETGAERGADITLVKNLPDGAGMGGGSADASFTLIELNRIAMKFGVSPLPPDRMKRLALSLGADCPFFLINRPAYAQGIGEDLSPVSLDLSAYRFVVVKPSVYVSTREAFSGISPHAASCNLVEAVALPPEEWRNMIHNDFEDSIFPLHPELGTIKNALYQAGAVYASLTGSGSALYGIFDSKQSAVAAADLFTSNPTIEAVYLLNK